MIIFKEKQYTLQEGHYTGPKDNVPGTFKTVAGSTIAGYVVGKIADEALDDPRKPVLGGPQPSSWSTKGATAGLVGGVMAKLLLNTIHNPMDSIKFNELDKCIRREFGMYREAGITVGDTKENRNKMKESFVINSKNLLDFKINVSVSRGFLTIYTLELNSSQEDDLNEILDYYCKKYFGMKYTSTPLGNKRNGSWIIDMVFTNHQIASNFLVEIGKTLNTRINLLNNDIYDDIKELTEKTYSFIGLDKVELKDIFCKGVLNSILDPSPRVIVMSIINGLSRLNPLELSSIGINKSEESYGSNYLENLMNKIDPGKSKWTLGDNDSNLNIYLYSGTLLVCVKNNSREEAIIKKQKELSKINSRDTRNNLYTYKMKTPAELEVLLKRITGSGVKPNVYTS